MRVKKSAFTDTPDNIFGAPKRIRIAVAGLKGRCPRPLDDGGTLVKYSRDRASRQRYTTSSLPKLTSSRRAIPASVQ